MFLDLEIKKAGKTAAEDIEGRSVTYGEIVRYCHRFRETISRRCLAFILCRNDVPTLLVYLACMENGIIPLLLGEKTGKESMENLLTQYQPACVFGYEAPLAHIFPQAGEEVVAGTGFCVIKTGWEGYPLYPELALLLTTSGSTGSPKLVRHSYRNLTRQAANISAFFEMDGTERPMVDLPVMYTYGLSVVHSYLYAGATLLLSGESILSRNFWRYFKERQATSFTGVPYSYELLKRLHFFSMPLPSLRMLSQGGGKLAPTLQREFAEYILGRGGKYVATYGQTECSARMAYLPSELAVEKCGSIGRAIPEGKLYLKDEDGRFITEAHQEGELYYEGPNVTLGYARCGTDLAKGDENHGIIATGDLAYTDEDGYFYISGRRKRFLKLFGYRVSLDECENIVKSAFPIECVCVGTDEKLKVFLCREDYRERVRDLLLEKTSLYASAVEVNCIDEIPRNEAGKVLYNALNEMPGR